jgi:hypothetical protein
MLSLKQASNIRTFNFKIENTTADRVTINSVDYYGGIIFNATASNPSYDFAVSSVSVYSVPNASGVTTLRTVGNVVFNKATGYIGVVITGVAVGDTISINGTFLAPSTAKTDEITDIGSTIGGVAPNLINLGSSNSITLNASANPVYLQ